MSFRLLDLPPEVRFRIFELLINEADIKRVWEFTSRQEKHRWVSKKSRRGYGSPRRQEAYKAFQNLVTSCRQIYDECLFSLRRPIHVEVEWSLFSRGVIATQRMADWAIEMRKADDINRLLVRTVNVNFMPEMWAWFFYTVTIILCPFVWLPIWMFHQAILLSVRLLWLWFRDPVLFTRAISRLIFLRLLNEEGMILHPIAINVWHCPTKKEEMLFANNALTHFPNLRTVTWLQLMEFRLMRLVFLSWPDIMERLVYFDGLDDDSLKKVMLVRKETHFENGKVKSQAVHTKNMPREFVADLSARHDGGRVTVTWENDG